MNLPDKACDTHFHIFGTAGEYQFALKRTYTPPPAPVAAYQALMKRVGFTRSVIVQPTVYGFDHACTLAGMKALGPDCRGVAVIGPDHEEAEIARLHEAGMRGARIALALSNAPVVPNGPSRASLPEIVARIKPFGWHLQVITDARTLPDLRPYLAALGVPIVIDHMGAFGGHADPTGLPGFQCLVEMLKEGAWVKLSAPYHMDPAISAPWLETVLARLIEAAPERVVWGTNWPHPNVAAPLPEEGWVETIGRVVTDEAQRTALFAGNAGRLYGWES